MSIFDSAVVLRPSPQLKKDGHHGAAIESAMREVLAETYDIPVTQHRLARRQLVIGAGELVVPFGSGWRLQSIRNLDIVLEPGAQIVGYGDMPAVVAIDGSSYGRLDAIRGSIEGRRALNGRRTEVPRDIVVIQKSIELPSVPNQTHFELRARIGGLWRDVAYRGGFPGWTTAQEDHFKVPELQVFGNYDIYGDLSADADLCRFGALAGNDAYSNNRRHYYGLIHVAWCETAFRAQTGTMAIVDRLVADGCRDFYQHHAARCVINGGEAELCGRLVNDTASHANDFPLVMRDVYAKLDGWRRGMGGVQPRFRDSAFAIWGTRGNCRFENVTIGSLPVKRGDDGTLRHVDAGAPPKFWSTQPIANVFFDAMSNVHGYTRAEVFAHLAEGSGTTRTEIGWKDTEPSGLVLRTMWDAADMRRMP